MNPVDFPQANFTFTRPSSMTDAECGSLRVHRGTDQDGFQVSVSKWQPTPEEREAIAKGEAVWLIVFGPGHPPVSLSGKDPFPKEVGRG